MAAPYVVHSSLQFSSRSIFNDLSQPRPSFCFGLLIIYTKWWFISEIPPSMSSETRQDHEMQFRTFDNSATKAYNPECVPGTTAHTCYLSYSLCVGFFLQHFLHCSFFIVFFPSVYPKCSCLKMSKKSTQQFEPGTFATHLFLPLSSCLAWVLSNQSEIPFEISKNKPTTAAPRHHADRPFMHPPTRLMHSV